MNFCEYRHEYCSVNHIIFKGELPEYLIRHTHPQSTISTISVTSSDSSY